jgi:hypothetical protein
MIALVAIGLGLFAGFAAGGTLGGLSNLRLRGEMAIISVFAVQGIARGRIVGTSASDWAMALWVAVSILLVGLLVLNARQPGALLAAAGMLLNLDVVLVNGAMPVVPGADAHVGAAVVLTSSGGFYRLASAGVLGLWAADVLNLSVLGQRYALSVGDLMLAVGVAVIIANAMIGAGPERTGLSTEG